MNAITDPAEMVRQAAIAADGNTEMLADPDMAVLRLYRRPPPTLPLDASAG